MHQDHEPEDAPAEEYFSRGRELMRAGKFAEAERQLLRALELEPGFDLAAALLKKLRARVVR